MNYVADSCPNTENGVHHLAYVNSKVCCKCGRQVVFPGDRLRLIDGVMFRQTPVRRYQLPRLNPLGVMFLLSAIFWLCLILRLLGVLP